MEEIYVNVEHVKSVNPRPSTNQTGPRSSERRYHGSVVLCLGLLSVFLLAGLIGIGVHYHESMRHLATEFSTIRDNLTEILLASDKKFSSLTEERHLLNTSLTVMTKELKRLNTCPAGWRMFMCSCYLLSNESDSWTRGREDCRTRGADLVVINSTEEQMFLSIFTEEKPYIWIGLTDKDQEGTWKWIDGAPLSLMYWKNTQPDNGGRHKTREEDCAHIISTWGDLNNWNDLSCDTSLRWICEKKF